MNQPQKMKTYYITEEQIAELRRIQTGAADKNSKSIYELVREIESQEMEAANEGIIAGGGVGPSKPPSVSKGIAAGGGPGSDSCTVTGAYIGSGGPGKPPSVNEGIIAGGGGAKYGQTFPIEALNSGVAGGGGGSGRNYLIWSEEHGAWWREASSGYTRSLLEAGRYSQEQAIAFVGHANKYSEKLMEIAFPAPYLG